jgi:hypothetical protein
MTIRARHRVFVRVSGSMVASPNLCSNIWKFQKFPKRLERSKAIERLERLELAAV